MDSQHPVSSTSALVSGGSSEGEGVAAEPPAPPPLITITDPANNVPCDFCKRVYLDELNLGPMYSLEDITVHYYCLLFSAGLGQTGGDEVGILGFETVNIRKEIKRCVRLKCKFCGVNGASVGCCKRSCRVMCHYPCGLTENVQYKFTKRFEAFCLEHSEHQDILLPKQDWGCPICMSIVAENEEPVMASCCKGAVFHKACLKRLALNAGYFFKCPICNEKNKFIQEVRTRGIFVPEQDASWEREPNAFADLYVEYSNCDAEVCLCELGREFNAEEGEFMLARCRICGAQGTHKKCSKVRSVENFTCPTCFEVVKKAGLNETPSSSTRRVSSSQHRVDPKVLKAMKMDPDFVDLTKVKIVKEHKDYFPYNREQLKQFKQKGLQCLPDWRNKSVRVNLVNWIGDFVAELNTSPSRLSLPSINNRIKETLTSPANKLPPVPKQLWLSPPPPPPEHKKKHKKASRWKRGMFVQKRSKSKDSQQAQIKTIKDYFAKTAKPNCKTLSQDITEEDVAQSDTPAEASPIDDFVFKMPLAKKRKVVELPHNIYAEGIARDFYVQHNMEVADADNSLESNDTDIAIQLDQELQVQGENSSESIPISTATTTTPLILFETQDDADILQNEEHIISNGEILFEHSYSKINKADVEFKYSNNKVLEQVADDLQKTESLVLSLP